MVLAKDKAYDLKEYITSFGSIYNEGIQKDHISVKINGPSNGLTAKGDGKKIEADDYVVTFELEDQGIKASKTLKVRVASGGETLYTFNQKESATSNVFFAETVGLYDGTKECYYNNTFVCNDTGSITFSIKDKNFQYLAVDYGIKDSVRKNTNYGSYGKVQLVIKADGKEIYTGETLGWKTPFERVFVEIPKGTSKVTLENKAVGAGNNHAGFGNLRFITDNK